MKLKFTFLAALLILSAEILSAAILRGVVVDQATGEPLLGATIMVKGTTVGTATNFDGSFEITVESETQPLVISYISYLSQEITAPSNTANLQVALVPDTQMLASVQVVTKANVENEYGAMVDQKEAIFATQVVGAKELSRKGVGDAEGAVMKVSGVSKQEGVKNVFVRGLGDRYNATTLNGFPIPSEDPEYKNISLDFFSTDVIQSVVVNKAFTAAGVADIGGANINITSKELTGDGNFNISISGGVNTQTIGEDVLMPDGTNAMGFANSTQPANYKKEYNFKNSLDPSVKGSNFNKSLALSGGKSFTVAENPLNIYLVASYDNKAKFYDEDVRNTDTTGEIIRNQEASRSEVSTSYLGLANINYEIGKKHSIDYNFMYVHSNDQSMTDYDGYYMTEVLAGYDYNGLVRRQQTNDNTLMVNQLMTNWELASRWDAEVGGSINSIKGLEPDRRINILGDAGDNYVTARGSGANRRFFSELNEDDINAKMAVSYRLSEDEDSKSLIKVGFNGRYVDNSFEATDYDYALYLSESYAKSGDIVLDSFFNADSFEAGKFVLDSSSDSYSVDKSINSTYADIVYQFNEKLVADLGLKYDIVEMTVDAEVDDAKSGNEINKSYFLPSLNLRYSLNDDHSIRLSASKTYTLPQAKEIAPYRYVGANFNSEGNVDLQPSENYNIDLKWDWYISKSELLTVTGFYKIIKNPISRIEIGSSGGFLSYENIADQATAAGVELEFRKNIFSRELDNYGYNRLSVGFNGSYIHTHVDTYESLVPTEEGGSQLEGAAPVILNGDLTYALKRENREFMSTLVYNYTSDRVYTVGTRGYENIVEKGRSTLDFVTSYKINDLKISFKATNLLNTAYELSRESSTNDTVVVLNRFKQGIDLSLGLSYNF